MKKLNSLRVKLTAFFLIPVIFIIIVGYTAYSIASSGMQETYESNAVTLCERYMIYLIYHFLTEEKGADLMSNTANMVRLVAE